MNKHLQTVLLCMVTIGTVVIGGLQIMLAPQKSHFVRVPLQSKWQNNDFLVGTLARYGDVYSSLTNEHEQRQLARLYLQLMLKDILLLPAKNDVGPVSVISPVIKAGNVSMVIKKIQLPANNGLHLAMQDLLKRRMVMPPTPKIGELVQYIIAGPNG
jgi:hypothetical protein